MARGDDYAVKFERQKSQTLFPLLSAEEQAFVQSTAVSYRFTFSELTWLCETVRDLAMWGERAAAKRWAELEQSLASMEDRRRRKKLLLSSLADEVAGLRREPKRYPAEGLCRPDRPEVSIVCESSPRRIEGPCPVCSEKTQCCGLRTIDVVQNCAYSCSYCTIQTFYGDEVVVDGRLAEKLRAIPVDPAEFYHFGTGQSSDSLAWGNRHNMLGELCEFAASHPNILLELKTKSANVADLLALKVPSNVVCSWSLNSETIISNEEHFTAGLDARLSAAAMAAARGILVAFHFHPLVYYTGWEDEYRSVARRLLAAFRPEQVLFVSLGSVTLIKPVIQQIRRRGGASKVLQMEMVSDPHGKVTYPDEIKIALYRTVYDALTEWHEKVYFYLCMERSEIWDALWGRHYADNQAFLDDFGARVGLAPKGAEKSKANAGR